MPESGQVLNSSAALLCLGLVFQLSYIGAVRESFQWFRTKTDCKDVMTEAGLVRGCVSACEDYIEFLGVPYAAPPTGQNRFRPPARPYMWKGVFEADRIVKCPQRGDGVEDCLIVNIFIPAKMNDKPLPVLVYFHGGSFLIGSGQVQGAQFLVKQNIIVVTVNYRLGALGFLCLGVEEAPGNAGMKDQVAALEWVQRNIAGFGGDPNRVTIYGMSAGGAAVELLVLSPKGKGLFHQAIVESGCATSSWVTDFDPLATALKMAEKLKIPKLKKGKLLSKTLANYYKRIQARHLSQVNYNYYNNLTDGTFGFVPCIEKSVSYNISDAFLTESPYETLTREKYNKVPMMFLFAAAEGLYLKSEEYYERNYKERMSEKFVDFLPRDLDFDSQEIKDAIAANIRQFYFGNRIIGQNIIEYLNYFGDHLVLHGLLNSAEIHSRNQNPVYLMEFAYKGNLGGYDKFFDNIALAGHGDVVKHVILNKRVNTENDKRAVGRVTKMIANFVKFGNPSPQRSRFLPVIWPAVKPGNVSALYLDEGFLVVDEPHWDAKEFWDALYSRFRRQFVSNSTDFDVDT